MKRTNTLLHLTIQVLPVIANCHLFVNDRFVMPSEPEKIPPSSLCLSVSFEDGEESVSSHSSPHNTKYLCFSSFNSVSSCRITLGLLLDRVISRRFRAIVCDSSCASAAWRKPACHTDRLLFHLVIIIRWNLFRNIISTS